MKSYFFDFEWRHRSLFEDGKSSYIVKKSYINIRNKKILLLKKSSYIQPWRKRLCVSVISTFNMRRPFAWAVRIAKLLLTGGW
jgi:hypothetical protein